MQFFINSQGTTVNLIADEVYQGSTNANEIVLVAPLSAANQVTAAFRLPIGVTTTPYVMKQQGNAMQIGNATYNIWRCLLDGAVTEYSGAVQVTFSVYQGNKIVLNTYSSSFNVSKGVVPQLPDEPSADVYSTIVEYLSSLNPQYNIQYILYETDDEYKIDTATAVKFISEYPSSLKMKYGVDFSVSNISGANANAVGFFAPGENVIEDVGFSLIFDEPTDIGVISLFISREYWQTAFAISVSTDSGNTYTQKQAFTSCVPSEESVACTFSINTSGVTNIKVISPYEKNVALDSETSIQEKGFTNGRFYVEKILLWKPNTDGYFNIVSSTGRTTPIYDAQSIKNYVDEQSAKAEADANNAQSAANEAANSADEANKSAAEAKDSADSLSASLNKSYIKSVSIRTDADNAYIDTISEAIGGGAETEKTSPINLATDTEAGFMSPSDYKQIRENTEKIGMLGQQAVRLNYTAKSNPTAEEINAFVVSLGYTPSPNVSVVVSATNHIWRYYTGTGWKDDGVDTVNQFTNAIAGTIKGADEDGKVYAETDGTGSVKGWSGVKSDISNLQSDKLSKTDISSNSPLYMDDGEKLNFRVDDTFFEGSNELRLRYNTDMFFGDSTGLNLKLRSTNGSNLSGLEFDEDAYYKGLRVKTGSYTNGLEINEYGELIVSSRYMYETIGGGYYGIGWDDTNAHMFVDAYSLHSGTDIFGTYSEYDDAFYYDYNANKFRLTGDFPFYTDGLNKPTRARFSKDSNNYFEIEAGFFEGDSSGNAAGLIAKSSNYPDGKLYFGFRGGNDWEPYLEFGKVSDSNGNLAYYVGNDHIFDANRAGVYMADGKSLYIGGSTDNDKALTVNTLPKYEGVVG